MLDGWLTPDDPRVVDENIDARNIAFELFDEFVQRLSVPKIAGIRSTSLPELDNVALTPTISAPALARPTASPNPIPRLQPVTRAVWPSRLNSGVFMRYTKIRDVTDNSS
jgi:hypothetical protein